MGTGIRPTGIDNAASALRYWERRQEVVANNLANVNTDGFKGERAFASLLSDGSTPAIDSRTDVRAGPMNSTGNPLDLAITGDGFFVVQTSHGERLTRGGSLSVSDQRQLVDAGGNLVLADEGPVVMPDHAASILVDAGGTVRVDGREVARLRVERTAPGAKLNHEGGGLFETSAPRTSLTSDERTIRQGMREESNVNSIESMVDMLSIQRAYANVQKMLTTIDSARGIATTELGKPAA